MCIVFEEETYRTAKNKMDAGQDRKTEILVQIGFAEAIAAVLGQCRVAGLAPCVIPRPRDGRRKPKKGVAVEGSDMRSVRIIPPLILLLLLAFPWACAQDPPPRLEVFLEGGGSFLNGGSGSVLGGVACPALCTPTGCVPCTSPSSVAVTSSFSKTARLFAGARLRFTRHDALEASYSYSPNVFSLQPAGQPTLSGYNRVDLVSFNYVRYLWAKTSFQPFVTGGVGVNRFSGPSNASAVLSGYVNADNGWQFAWNYGGGADLVLQRHLALRLELRDYITGQPKPSSINGMGGTSHNIVPSAGIVFRFK